MKWNMGLNRGLPDDESPEAWHGDVVRPLEVDQLARIEPVRLPSIWAADERTVQVQQEEVIAALLTYGTVDAAASMAQIPVERVRTWMTCPDFQAAYEVARRADTEARILDSVWALKTLTPEAVDALKRNLTCGDPGVEVSAARAILDLAGTSGGTLIGREAPRI